MNLLIGVTGSVAAVKLTELVEMILKLYPNTNIRVVATQQARVFLKNQTIHNMYQDEAEWTEWTERGDPVLHIELRKWADVFLIAPLSANSLAKLAQGLCDNLLTSIVRAWDVEKRLIVAPAMNTFMWDNPFTQKHLGVITEVYRAEVIPPKPDYILACGDRGAGAMAAVNDIVNHIFPSDRS